MATNEKTKDSRDKDGAKMPTKITAKRTVVLKPINGFSEFLREYGVVALAVGFVFGAQVKSVVDQLTASFINPILGLVLPGKGDLATKSFTLHNGIKSTSFAWGAFVSTFLSFIVVTFVIYIIIKSLKLDKFDKKA